MKDRLLRVLMVDDSDDDVQLIIRELKKGGYDPLYERVETASAMQKALQEKQWDIVLCDYKMPKFNAPSAITLFKKANIDIPLIIVSGAIDEETAAECMRLGAQDYIMKGNLSRLCPAISRELEDVEARNKQRQAENALRRSEEKYRTILKNIEDGYYEVDIKGNFTFFNDSMCRIIGYSPEEMMGMNNRQFTDKENAKKLFKTFNEVYRTGFIAKALDWQIIRKDETKRYIEVSVSLQKDSSGKPIGFQGIARDITDRKRVAEELKESENKYRLLADNIHDVVFFMDMNLNYTYISPSVKLLRGYEPEEAMKHTPVETVTPSSVDLALRTLFEILETEKSEQRELNISRTLQLEMSRKDGTTVWVETKASIVRDENQRPVGIMGVTRDITERKQAEDTLRKSEQIYRELSIIDDLTQLYNSRHFYAQLEREIERANRYKQPLTLLLLDLDKFKEFNDTYGHVEGDYVLSQLGQVVKRCLRETDSAYRYGGEEFTIILPMTTNEEGMVTAQRIQTELRKESFSPALDQKVYMTVSIGLTQYKPKEEMKTFVQRVDQLMYQAKKNGRDRICSES